MGKGWYYKRKVEVVTKEVKTKISKALDYDIQMSEDERNFIKKAEDFDKLVGLLKEKLMSVRTSKKSRF
ncbi:hypothetical protein QYM36_018630 [Artemia franciscana]|uniref:Uncharacterized protein n=1 Tax=Artemia franciscana TaxID=6661 RepID=A0AA88H3N7_ARTSF|nr:hypothetical protein QYM36_018630 [Artemia franciscana]